MKLHLLANETDFLKLLDILQEHLLQIDECLVSYFDYKSPNFEKLKQEIKDLKILISAEQS